MLPYIYDIAISVVNFQIILIVVVKNLLYYMVHFMMNMVLIQLVHMFVILLVHHTPYVLDDGCIIFVKLYQMSEVGEVYNNHSSSSLYLQTSLYHDNNDDHHARDNHSSNTTSYPTIQYIDMEYGKIGQLFHNQITNELVQMIWLNPYCEVPVNEDCDGGGEELLIINGSLTFLWKTTSTLSSTTEQQKQMEGEYQQWSWLRFPPTNNKEDEGRLQQIRTPYPLRIIKAGKDGVHLYRKTNHLTLKALSMEKMKMAI